jgi:hypothetical protein
MYRITIAKTIRHRSSSTNLCKRLSIEPIDTFTIAACFDEVARSFERPFTRAQMNWGRNTHNAPSDCV